MIEQNAALTKEEITKIILAVNEGLIETYKTTHPSWTEHIDLVQIALVGLVGYFIWSWKRILDKFEASLTDIQHQQSKHQDRISRLEGRIEHHGLICYGRRSSDDRPPAPQEEEE